MLLIILSKILPLYLIIACGFIAAKFLKIDKEQISSLAIYIFAPAVVFLGTINAGLKINILLLPIFSFLFMSAICLINYQIGKFFWKDSTRNLFAYSSATGNTGYFGLPICLMLIGENALAPAVMFVLGGILFENTIGYYIFARSHYSKKDALKKVLKLPSLYAFVVGMIFNLGKIQTPTEVINFFEILKGGYVPIGMMIVGLGLAGVKIRHIDKKFIALTNINKFLIWGMILISSIFLDMHFFKVGNETIYKVLIMISAVPLAANSVAFASYFKTHPEKAAISVMISNFIAIITVPLAAIAIESLF